MSGLGEFVNESLQAAILCKEPAESHREQIWRAGKAALPGRSADIESSNPIVFCPLVGCWI